MMQNEADEVIKKRPVATSYDAEAHPVSPVENASTGLVYSLRYLLKHSSSLLTA